MLKFSLCLPFAIILSIILLLTFFFFFFFLLPTVLSSRGIYKIGGKEKCVFHRPSSVGQKLSNEPANEMALHL